MKSITILQVELPYPDCPLGWLHLVADTVAGIGVLLFVLVVAALYGFTLPL